MAYAGKSAADPSITHAIAAALASGSEEVVVGGGGPLRSGIGVIGVGPGSCSRGTRMTIAAALTWSPRQGRILFRGSGCNGLWLVGRSWSV